MFTGIVEALGSVAALEHRDGDARVTIDSGDLEVGDLSEGDSIAVNGACLTAVDLGEGTFAADVSGETLAFTALGGLSVGDRVNLERAMAATDRFDGHIVSGHVDGVGTVVNRHPDARSERFRLRAPEALARYIARKGSITVDGVSLTVNHVTGSEFEVNIVPHTLKATIIGDYRPDTRVNLEVDLIARYLERLMQSGADASAKPDEGDR